MKDTGKKTKPVYSVPSNVCFMIRTAWHSYKSVLVMLVIVALLNAGETVAQMLATPLLLKTLESDASLAQMLGTIALIAAGLMLLSGLHSYCRSNALYARIAVRSKLLTQVAGKFSGTSYPNTLKPDFIKLLDKAHSCLGGNSDASEAVWTTLCTLLANLLGFAVYLLLLSGLHPILMVVVLVSSGVGFFINQRLNRWEYEHRDEETNLRRPWNVVQKVAKRPFAPYGKDIRLFGLRPWLEDVWRAADETLCAFNRRLEKHYLWLHVVDLVTTLLRNGVAYAYLITLTLRNNLPVSEFVLYFSAVSGFSAWISGILSQCATLHTQSLDLSTLREFLDYPEPFRFEDGEDVPWKPGDPCVLTLEDVSFRYDGADTDTIRHLSLTLHASEKLAIVGLNGAGKTTLVKLLCGFLDPTEGRVLFNGHDLRTLNRRQYYGLFSAVFQHFSVLDSEIATNVAQTLDAVDEEKVNRCLALAGLTEKVASLPGGIHTHIGRNVFEDGTELSGGETQRLMLARALYKDGPILALDEPTAALDPIAEDDIYQKYASMASGKTSLFISHRLASTRFCDRIIFIADGVIAEEGTHEALMAKNGRYAELFEVQSQYYREGGQEHEQP